MYFRDICVLCVCMCQWKNKMSKTKKKCAIKFNKPFIVYSQLSYIKNPSTIWWIHSLSQHIQHFTTPAWNTEKNLVIILFFLLQEVWLPSKNYIIFASTFCLKISLLYFFMNEMKIQQK